MEIIYKIINNKIRKFKYNRESNYMKNNAMEYIL
jgi:hypothetical protein